MPRGPRYAKRPVDVNARSAKIARIALGEIEDTGPALADEGKDPAAVALGRKGGMARAEAISARRRKEIAQQAARKRWEKNTARNPR